MVHTKTTRDIEILREAGKRLAQVFAKVRERVVPGISTRTLDEIAEKAIRGGGDVPAFLHYTPDGAQYPYPATLCVSVNDEVVHGIPAEKILRSGDIVGLDLGLIHEGLYVDMAETVPVGVVDATAKKLIAATRESLAKGIAAASSGAHTGDIGNAIENHIKKNGFSIVQELGGHGVGYKLHEEPYIPNFGKKGAGALLRERMVIAIEPIVNEGKQDIVLGKDGYTYHTKDGSRSAHFEHTILITKGVPEILTR